MGELIRPSPELRNRYNEVIKECKERNAATILTVNGKGDSAIMSYEKYNELMDELQLYRDLAEAEADVREGRVSLASETYDSIRKKIESMEL